MADKLDQYAFPDRGSYPWELWLDCSPWRLHRGQDFTVETPRMRVAASQAAKRRHLGMRTHVEDEDTIVIQAFKA